MTTITISSRELAAIDPTLDPSSFICNFHPAIELGSLNYEVCLFHFNGWFTARNIVGRTLDFDDGTTFVSIGIPDGIYTVEDLNNVLAERLRTLGWCEADALTGNINYGITILPNYNTNRVVITIDNSILAGAKTFTYTFGGAGSLETFLGFNAGNITATTQGPNVPQVSGGIDQWQIRCDLIRNSYDNGKASDIFYSFTPAVPPSASIDITPVHLSYLQVNKSTIGGIRFRLTDQDGELIDLAGEHVVYTIKIRKIGSSE